jgi:hypothetical protein
MTKTQSTQKDFTPGGQPVKANPYQIISYHDAAEGNLVRFYGHTFTLTNRRVWPMEAGFDPVTQGECITFDGVLVGDHDPNQIPLGYLTKKDGYLIWKFQGNKLATLNKLIAKA